MNTERLLSKNKLVIAFMVVLGVSVMVQPPLQATSQEVAVNVGDSFTFIVNRLHMTIKVADDTASADKFTVDDKNPTSPGPNAKITVKVVDTSSDAFGGKAVTYEVSLGDAKANVLESSIVARFQVLSMSIFPYYLSLFVTSFDGPLPITGSNNTNIEDGFAYIIPVTGTSDDFWNSLDEEIKSSVADFKNKSSGLSIEHENTQSGGDFEVYMKVEGTVRNETTNEELTIDSKMRSVYEMDTGVLQGFKMDSSFEGTISGDDVIIRMDIEINREGYQIEGFGGGGFFGLSIPALEAPIFFLGMLTVAVGLSRIRRHK